MTIAGIPTGSGNDTVTVTPTGWHSADGQGGTDTLVVDYSTRTDGIDYRYAGGGWYTFTDDFSSGITFIGFEKYNLKGGSGDDTLAGGNDVDILLGGNGNDTLLSGLGADTIGGGGGLFDRWQADYSSINSDTNVQLLNVGNFTVLSSGAVISGIEALTLNTGIGNDTVDTNLVTGDDVLYTGAGNDTFKTKGGSDTWDGGADTDRLVVDYSDAATVVNQTYQGGGWYLISDAAATQSVRYINVDSYDLTGGSAGDALSGGGLNDRLVGNAGDDLLNGGAGADTIDGGDGIDTWQVDYSGRANSTVDLTTQTTNTGATITGIEAIRYTGGAGIDRVTANTGVFNDSFYTGVGNDIITTGRGMDVVDGGGDTDKLIMDWSAISDPMQGIVTTYRGGGWYRMASNSGDQLDFINIDQFDLKGGAGADSLSGGGLKDWLTGNGGDDRLDSAVGDAVIDGGAGNDTWVANLAAETAKVLFNATASQTTAQGTAAGNSILGIEAVELQTGVGADNISTAGFALNDWIATGAGTDTVASGLGVDTLDGQGDVDLLVLNYSALSSAVSSSYQSGGWYLYGTADGVNRANYINFERFNVTGGSGDDALTGGNYNDVLNGGLGNDTLNGGAGNDSIVGAGGNDTWIGDYSGATTALAITVVNGNGTLAGTGISTTISSIENISLSTGTNNDTINITNSLGNDHIYANGGDDFVDIGRGFKEWFDGGGGTDTLQVDFLSANSGVRMAYESGGWYSAKSTSGNYRLDFINADKLIVEGSNFNDRMFGFGNSDTLSGRNGNDILNGGNGNDTLTGGLGHDLFVFDDLWAAGVDTITDANAVDHDMIRLSGLTLNGISNGNGSTALAGFVEVESSGGVTTLHVGLDGVAGADFNLQLTGTFSAASFTISGTDLLL